MRMILRCYESGSELNSRRDYSLLACNAIVMANSMYETAAYADRVATQIAGLAFHDLRLIAGRYLTPSLQFRRKSY